MNQSGFHDFHGSCQGFLANYSIEHGISSLIISLKMFKVFWKGMKNYQAGEILEGSSSQLVRAQYPWLVSL